MFAAIVALGVVTAAVPTSASAGHIQHGVHIDDGQGDSPLVP
jgi:hypothetical protein